MTRKRLWKVSDEWWKKVKPLIPPAPSRAKGGRPRMDDRQAFAAIISCCAQVPNGMRCRGNWARPYKHHQAQSHPSEPTRPHAHSQLSHVICFYDDCWTAS